MPADEASTSVAPGAQQSWGLAAGDELIPRCWVQSRLGGGHSYEAYACFDQRLLASVVVKVVRPHLTDDESTLRTLERETTILGRVNHPVIVRGLHAELGGPRPTSPWSACPVRACRPCCASTDRCRSSNSCHWACRSHQP